MNGIGSTARLGSWSWRAWERSTPFVWTSSTSGRLKRASTPDLKSARKMMQTHLPAMLSIDGFSNVCPTHRKASGVCSGEKTGSSLLGSRLRSATLKLSKHRDFAARWRRDPFDRDSEIDRVMLSLAQVGA